MAKHVGSLSIERFRGIRSGRVEGLADINVFVGPNNSGKSTILEALYYFGGPLQRNDRLKQPKRDVLRNLRNCGSSNTSFWYAYRTSQPISIVVRSSVMMLETLSFSNGTEGTGVRVGQWLYSLGSNRAPAILSAHDSGYKRTWDRVRLDGSGIDTGSMDTDEAAMLSLARVMAGTQLITPELRNQQLVEQTLWRDLLRERGDKYVTERLRSIYSKNIESVQFTPFDEGSAPVLVLLFPDMTVRLDDLGDGTRLFVRMLLLLGLLKDTVLLLEEPEVSHHPASLRQVCREVVVGAKERNLQVFVTTHSLDCLRAFLAYSQEAGLEFRAYHTRLADGQLTARYADADDTAVLLDMGLDPRLSAADQSTYRAADR